MNEAARILVVDDNDLIVQLIADVLVEPDYRLIGPGTTMAEAMHFAASEAIHLAVLDVNVGGELITPVADKLIERRIPFLFMTGVGPLPQRRFKTVLTLRKPFLLDDLLGGIAALLPASLRRERDRAGALPP